LLITSRLGEGLAGVKPWVPRVIALALLISLFAAPVRSQQASAEPSPPVFNKVSDYEGLTISQIEIRGTSSGSRAKLLESLPLKAGDVLDKAKLQQSIQTLYASGRFADIQAEAERTPDRHLNLVFSVTSNYFIGDINVEGAPGRPTENQIVNATKLQLGEQFTKQKMERGLQRVRTLLEEDGFYHAKISFNEELDSETQLATITIHISAGEEALIGAVTATGQPRYSPVEIRDIAHMHAGDPVSSDRLTTGLEKLRKKYQKQNRLLAQVAVTHAYRPEKNEVDYTFNIDPGPVVTISVDGFHLSRRVIKKNIPVYEENALDDDLLNEGRRNLLDYLQTRGYFEAKVGIKKQTPQADSLQVTYVIDPGPLHKLVAIQFKGNEYFTSDVMLARMQVQRAGRLLSYGRYSQSLLASDQRGLEELYRANGFAQVKITPKVIDNYENLQNQLAVQMFIDEGPQTIVASLQIGGNNTLPTDELLPLLSTVEGQPYSDFNVSSDRDAILNYYFNHGFPNATFESTAKPVPDNAARMDVSFTIHEGQQIFVDQVLVSGLHYTRPYIVDRQLQVRPGAPVSQIDMLDTQRRLYDLGVFNQVDTAVQNPEGTGPNKNILVNVHEAKRYTFNYGVGLEVQTGTPSGSNAPSGRTGVSPRVSFDVTRINFRGRDHTITFKSHVGRLQQRVLLSYDAPRWFNKENLRLTLTAFYDNTFDVSTFASKRLQGSIQAEQSVGRGSTLFYRFSYRKVQAANFANNFSPNEVPLLSQPTRVGMPGFSYIRDHRDNPLESKKGSYVTFDSGVASSDFGSEADFSRLLVQYSTYYTFKKKYVFARSTSIGVETPFRDTIIQSPSQAVEPLPPGQTLIPLPERFFSGGGNSLRGFGLNQAGPRDLNSGFPVGGSGLFINNLELRFPPMLLPFFQDNLSFAVFHDAGNVFDTGHDMLHSLIHWKQRNPELCQQQSTYQHCDFNYVSHALGVGVRYRTPVGPVRFDFGYNLNPPAFPSFVTSATNQQIFQSRQASHFNVYFSIGQTF
jgi:outer membrane protein insertion porin family